MERNSSKEYSVVFVVEGEKFKLRKLPSRFIFVFRLRGGAGNTVEQHTVPKHSRVSEVFQGFNLHDFEHNGQRNYDLKWEFSLCH